MEKIISITKSVSNKYVAIAAVLLPLLLIILTVDIVVKFSQTLDGSMLYYLSLILGRTGVFLAIISFLFFPLRKIFISLKRKNSSKQYESLKNTAALMSNIHPLLSLLALLVLLTHGYLFLFNLYGFSFSAVIIFGISALIILLFLFASGTIIKRNPANKIIRKVHFAIVFAFIVFFVLHRIFMF